MIHKAYVQKSSKTQEFINANVYSAWLGFEAIGVPTESFTWAQMEAGDLELTRDTIVVGGIPPVHMALDRLGIPKPDLSDYPHSLQPYLCRSVRLSTLREAHHSESPIFVKPAGGLKAFDGHTLQCFKDSLRTARMVQTTPDMPVWISEVVTFCTEWRYFIRQGQIQGLSHYRGSEWVHPNPQVVQRAIKDFEASDEAPVAYVIDFGVLEDGRTALIEVNDGYSFGAYGLNSVRHIRMLEDRWCQLVGLPQILR